ncbi:MAG: response regulator, partial [Deltaproteobacteria bacterium]|nr:response regulator [Deltaproteobacteria bacterium]
MKILIADDEKPIRDGCERVLTSKGFDVLSAENGQIALDIMSKEDVSILLLDLKMPIMGGEEVLALTGTRYPEIPVIIITGHGTVDTAVECMKKGAYDFITKPFQIEQFLATINRAAEKRKLEQKAKQLQEQNVRDLYDLSLEKSRLKTIINYMANGVIVTNRNMEVVLNNPAIKRLLEISKAVENPVPATEIINDESLLDTLTLILNDNAPDNKCISQEIESGSYFLRAISAPVLGPDADIVGAVTVLENITAFKQLDQMKSDFVNMVAHELRSPLVAIRQLNSVILDGLAGPLGEKQTEFINRGVKKIDALL